MTDGLKNPYRDLLRYSAVLGQTTDARAIRALVELIRETKAQVIAIEEARELAAE